MSRQPTLQELESRLDALEEERKLKRGVNRCYRVTKGTGLDVFATISTRYTPEAADAARACIKEHGGKVPWNRKALGALRVAIYEVRAAIAEIKARDDTAKRATVAGNGWSLTDDTDRGLVVINVACETKQIKFALRGNGFKRSSTVGWCRARSASAWEAGNSVGKKIEEERGEHVPGDTDPCGHR